eukprot:5469447-Alexandrium_andersonii.AAC.1
MKGGSSVPPPPDARVVRPPSCTGPPCLVPPARWVAEDLTASALRSSTPQDSRDAGQERPGGAECPVALSRVGSALPDLPP